MCRRSCTLVCILTQRDGCRLERATGQYCNINFISINIAGSAWSAAFPRSFAFLFPRPTLFSYIAPYVPLGFIIAVTSFCDLNGAITSLTNTTTYRPIQQCCDPCNYVHWYECCKIDNLSRNGSIIYTRALFQRKRAGIIKREMQKREVITVCTIITGILRERIYL